VVLGLAIFGQRRCLNRGNDLLGRGSRLAELFRHRVRSDRAGYIRTIGRSRLLAVPPAARRKGGRRISGPAMLAKPEPAQGTTHRSRRYGAWNAAAYA